MNFTSTIIFLIIIGLIFLPGKIELILNYILMTILAIIYSAPPFRLKEKPPLDLISHAFFFGCQLFLHGYFTLNMNFNWSLEIVKILFLISIYSLILQLRNHIEDYHYDLKANYKTIAIKLGLSKSLKLLFILTLIFFIYSIIIISQINLLYVTPILISTLITLIAKYNIMSFCRLIDLIAIFTISLTSLEKFFINSMLITNNMISNWISIFRSLGLLGIFLSSFIGNATPYAGLPYLLVVIEYASIINPSIWELFLISFLGGFGSALGKIVIWLLGRAMNTLLSDEAKRNLNRFSKLFERSLFTAIFLFAALPLPDDLLYVPISISKYDPIKFFIAVFLGKIIIVGFTAFIGKSISIIFSGNPLIAGLTSLLISIIILITIIKIDWEKVALNADKKGWINTLIELIRMPSKFLK